MSKLKYIIGAVILFVASLYALSSLGFSGVNNIKSGWDDISIYFITIKYCALLLLFANYKALALKVAERNNNDDIYVFLMERRRLLIVAVVAIEFIGVVS